jgi:hypothetical protein
VTLRGSGTTCAPSASIGTTCGGVAAIVEEVLGGASDGTDAEQAAHQSTVSVVPTMSGVALGAPRWRPVFNCTRNILLVVAHSVM